MPTHIDWRRVIELCQFELRTPMSVTAGYITMTLATDVLDKKQRAWLEEARKALRRCTDLLHGDLGSLFQLESRIASGREPFSLTTVDLRAVLRQALESLPEAAHLAGPILAPREGVAWIRGDEASLTTAFQDLLDEVRRESRDDGCAVVQEWVGTHLGTPASWVVMGSAPNIERFATAPMEAWGSFYERSVKATLARCVVELHDGAIWSWEGRRGTIEKALQAVLVVLPHT